MLRSVMNVLLRATQPDKVTMATSELCPRELNAAIERSTES